MAVALIGIDWGTSSARAYWLAPNGEIVKERSAPLGVQRIVNADFAAALAALCGDDIAGDIPLLACGMIGSRQGWVEAPYRDCPAPFAAIASLLTPVPGTRLAIVPGLICRDADGVPDVMRGEETQIAGAIAGAVSRRQVVLLPGTHSKWAIVGPEGIETFATFLTGELYAVLREHSILGRLAVAGADDAALERGIRHSLRVGAALLHDLFAARTLALTGALAPEGVADYLSGLLLGAEVGAARAWLAQRGLAAAAVTLIGDAALCERYRRPLALSGITAALGPAQAAAYGLWRIAQQAGLVTS